MFLVKLVDAGLVVLLIMLDETCIVLAAIVLPTVVIGVENYFINKFDVDRGFTMVIVMDDMS